MGYSALRTGLALIPFALAAVLGSAVLAPRLVPLVRPRWLVTAGIVLSAAGLFVLLGLTKSSHYVPLILASTIIEGLGTGIGGPVILQTALRGVQPGDTGAASAASSTAGQLGASIGAALLNTIAATAAASYLSASPSAGELAATVHGFTVAMVWGAVILLAALVPVIILIDAPVLARRR